MIYIECNPDFILVKFITNVPRRESVHELKGKYGVCNQLAKRSNCKGLIDEEPSSVEHPYIRRLGLCEDLHEHGLKVLHDSSNDNYLIVICPNLEDWVIKAAKEINIDVRKYNLPDDAARLHREINLKLDKFEKLLEDLSLNGSERLKILKRLLGRG